MSTTKLYCSLHRAPWSSRFEQWHIQYLWERSRLTTVNTPDDPRGPKKRQETSRRRRSSVGTPWWTQAAPRFVVDLGRLCFILVLFDAENQVYLILLAVFLLDMELKPKKTWTEFSTYDRSSLKACHLLRKNKLVLVTMHEINMQRCCFMANCMAQATQSHLLSQPPYPHAVFGPMKGALVCGNQLRQLKIHENPLIINKAF